MSGAHVVEHCDVMGWDVVRLRSDRLEVDVMPGKGADIVALRWRPLGANVLWTTPWGVRQRGRVGTAAGSVTAFMESYFGGWQTLFPNGGPSCEEAGAELGFHGEACLAPWEVVSEAEGETAAVELTTTLVRSPFTLNKHIEVRGDAVRVTESVRNGGSEPREVMWGHHPAFGPPLLGEGARVETAATWFEADDERDTVHGDLQPGSRRDWPLGTARDGGVVDLSVLPGPGERIDRFGYLGGFDRGWCAIVNPRLPLRVDITWDESVFEYAWIWLEAHASDGFPWFGRAYVLGLEPGSSFPGQGLDAVRKKTGTQLRIAPGEERVVWVEMKVAAEGAA